MINAEISTYTHCLYIRESGIEKTICKREREREREREKETQTRIKIKKI